MASKSINDTINYYAVLGLKNDANMNEIKRAYQKKLRKYHPDKIESTKENKLKYKMIREAGNILTHTQKRKAYDEQLKQNKSPQDYISQKDSFKEFMKLQEHNMTDEDIKIAKLNFDKMLKQYEKDNGIYRDEKILSTDEYTRKMEDLILQREQEEFELNNDNIFEGMEYNTNEFNGIFEKHKNKKRTSDGMIVYTDNICAYNNNDDEGMSLDSYGLLYATGNYTDYNENYTGVNNNISENDDTSDDISIDSLDEEEDVKLETKKENDTLDTAIKNIISERKTDDEKITNMTDTEYGSALNDEYGISKHFGFMIGNDRNGQQNIRNTKLTKSNIKIYKELTQE